MSDTQESEKRIKELEHNSAVLHEVINGLTQDIKLCQHNLNVARQDIDWWTELYMTESKNYRKQRRYNMILVLIIALLMSAPVGVLLTQEVRVGDVCLSCWGK